MVKYKYHVIYYDAKRPYVEWVREAELLESFYRQNKHILLLYRKALNVKDLVKKYATLVEERTPKNVINIDASTFSKMIDSFVSLLNKTNVITTNKTISTVFNDVFNYFNIQPTATLFIFHDAKATNILLQNIDQYLTDDYMNISVLVISDEREWEFDKYATFYILKVYKDQSVSINNATFLMSDEYYGPGRLRKNRTSNEIINDIRKNWTYITKIVKRKVDENANAMSVNANAMSVNESLQIWPWMHKLLKANTKEERITTETSEEQWVWVNDQLLQFNSKNLIRNAL